MATLSLAWGCEHSVAAPAQTPTVQPDPLPPPAAPDIVLPAFPEAEGWGASALNASRKLPLRVHLVTNSESTGQGSLQAALEQTSSDHFDVIIFRVGGRIEAPTREGFRLDQSHVYVAGQTAPGSGVVIHGTGTSFWLRGNGPNINDVVFRYVRFRGSSGLTRNNLLIAKGQRIVLDHLSFSWTDNYLLALLRYDADFSAPISDVSIQHTIFSEAFDIHPTAVHIATGNELRNEQMIGLENVSMHRNLFAHNSHRNPNSGADNIAIINNVLYNWNQGTMQLTQRGVADFLNNYGKEGPMTHPAYRFMVNPRCDAGGVVSTFHIFASGNIGPLSYDPDGDNWTGNTRQVACYYRSGAYDGQEAPDEWRAVEPGDPGRMPFPVSARPAHEAFDQVLDDVGANARLTCAGEWVPAIDVVDARVLEDVRVGSGPSRPVLDEAAVGGWPGYERGTPCADTDGDGLPDAWEVRFFGCSTCAEPSDVGRNGYLVVEHYLNGTDPTEP